VAIKVVFTMVSKPGCLVIVASPGLRQSAEFLLKAKGMVRRLGFPVRGDGVNPVSLVLPNGSRVVGLPETPDTVRGFSNVALLVFDEAALVDTNMFTALRPLMATSDGDMWMMSTPCGKKGVFYDTWQYGGPEWFRMEVKATDCPRISQQFSGGGTAGSAGLSKFEQDRRGVLQYGEAAVPTEHGGADFGFGDERVGQVPMGIDG
jgi:hypothetical protein